MALQITRKKGKFYLKGKLNNSTANFFVTYFQYNIKKYKKLSVNIDGVKEITRDGLTAISTLISIALKKDKSFLVVGYGCKEIYDDFDQMDVA
ncbi:hypothetical protein [Tenacibaculum aestuariivivum]|uniref:hypothetical protein n=1 Tax=Tenacibaculum aestuariivivum TaxID=2006131 RepID=UPI003AB700E2